MHKIIKMQLTHFLHQKVYNCPVILNLLEFQTQCLYYLE